MGENEGLGRKLLVRVGGKLWLYPREHKATSMAMISKYVRIAGVGSRTHPVSWDGGRWQISLHR